MTNVVNHNNLPNKDLNLSSEQHSQVEEKYRVPVGKDYTIFFIKKIILIKIHHHHLKR